MKLENKETTDLQSNFTQILCR